MSAVEAEVFIIGVKRAFRDTVNLPDIFKQAGITGVAIQQPQMTRSSLTADQRKALEPFSDRLHIEKPIPHF